VTHYYAKISVAEIRAMGELKVGDEFVIIGETSGVVEGTVESLRLDDGEVPSAQNGDIFAIKVHQRVRRNDKFFFNGSRSTEMKYIKIAHKKTECIGCAFCTEVAPGYWQMDENGEAQLIQAVRGNAQFDFGNGFVEDRHVLEQAQKGCPVGIIRIE
jgi:ferredoxin